MVCVVFRIAVGPLVFWKEDFEFFKDLLHLYLIGVTEIKDGVANAVAHFLQKVLVEVVVSKLALVSSTEGSLTGESVGDT